jgi:hypothetical protein
MDDFMKKSRKMVSDMDDFMKKSRKMVSDVESLVTWAEFCILNPLKGWVPLPQF